MLSKKQARAFFLGGTILFASIFLLLSLDTVGNKVKSQTKEENLSESVIRGKHLFDNNNCMGCHTILGEGAYYAPELTKVYERRGPQWIKMFIKDPEAMYPGQRKMIKYDFNEKELDDLVSFFKWIGEMDLNGFPPKPTYKTEKAKN
jgi:nitric oxide reductase subunit C